MYRAESGVDRDPVAFVEHLVVLAVARIVDDQIVFGRNPLDQFPERLKDQRPGSRFVVEPGDPCLLELIPVDQQLGEGLGILRAIVERWQKPVLVDSDAEEKISSAVELKSGRVGLEPTDVFVGEGHRVRGLVEPKRYALPGCVGMIFVSVGAWDRILWEGGKVETFV